MPSAVVVGKTCVLASARVVGRAFPVVLLVAACATPGRPPAPAIGAPSPRAVDPHRAEVVSRPDATGPVAAAVPPAPESARGEPDRDHDRIPDSQDKCPDEPETHNGFQDSDGCPDHGSVGVHVPLAIYDKIYFASGSRTPIPRTTPLIEAIAAALKAHPQLAVVGVVGYASDEERDPIRLTTARAVAVRNALVKLGVSPARLRTHGYGTESPLCAGHDEECRSHNRRVEFPTFEHGPPPAPIFLGPLDPSIVKP